MNNVVLFLGSDFESWEMRGMKWSNEAKSDRILITQHLGDELTDQQRRKDLVRDEKQSSL